jgi:hypothetical protein
MWEREKKQNKTNTRLDIIIKKKRRRRSCICLTGRLLYLELSDIELGLNDHR